VPGNFSATSIAQVDDPLGVVPDRREEVLATGQFQHQRVLEFFAVLLDDVVGVGRFDFSS